MEASSYNKVKFFSIVIFLIFSVATSLFIHSFSHNKFNNSFDLNIMNTQKFVKNSVKSFILIKTEYYIEKSNFIFNQNDILTAMELKDRDRFNMLVQKYYKRLKIADNNLWGLHVILPDNLSFIRIHKPNSIDDYIKKGKKPLVDYVNKNKKYISGFDDGKFGYFFRIVIPIFSKTNKYLGLLEYSINLSDFTTLIYDKYGYESAFLINNQNNKEFLNDLKTTINHLKIFKPTSNNLKNMLIKNIDDNLIYKQNDKYMKLFFIDLNNESKLAISFDITDVMINKLSFDKNSFNFLISFLVIGFIVWFLLTFIIIKLLKFRDKATNELKEINKELDQKVKDKTKEIQSLLDTFDTKVIASRTDLKGKITYASYAYEQISGYSQEELIGTPHNIARHPDMPKEIFKSMWDTLKKDNIWKGEIKNRRKNGETYWLKAVIEPLYENGIKVGYSAVRENITSKKALEELNQTLELKVKERTQEIENQLYFDKLTGLGSYQALTQDVNNSDFMFTTLMLINIDNFQNINGLYGFEAGNKMLNDFASCLEEFNQDKPYKIYRIYADEFVLFNNCEFTCIEDYYADLLKLKDTIQSYKFYIDSIGENIFIDATIGISLGQENPITTVDMALRYAKQHKLNFQTYNSTLDIKDQLQDTIIWKDKIKKAIKEDRILPVFQPILNKQQQIIKYEVLTRMQENINDTTNLISPNKFLEESINAKQYNNIAKIVFKKAFEVMQNSDKLFSINLSYDDIYNNTLISFIENYIKQNDDIASRLVIEILETTEIGNQDIMKEFIVKFRSYGIQIAIDDFGTGHSNLSHILDMKPDFLKIDGAFIKHINEDKQSYAMVKSVVAFCKELDIKTIAEYVHSKEVFDTLYELGIDEFQGFYFSEPKVEI